MWSKTTYPETIDIPWIEVNWTMPWVDWMQYNNINVRKEKAETWWIKIWTHTIPKLTTTWSYDIVSTNIDFIPSYIRIQASQWLWRITWYSDMWTDWTLSWGNYYDWKNTTDDAWIWYNSYTRLILCTCSDTSSYTLAANFVAFIDWWVTIDITSNTSISNIECLITAYK